MFDFESNEEENRYAPEVGCNSAGVAPLLLQRAPKKSYYSRKGNEKFGKLRFLPFKNRICNNNNNNNRNHQNSTAVESICN